MRHLIIHKKHDPIDDESWVLVPIDCVNANGEIVETSVVSMYKHRPKVDEKIPADENHGELRVVKVYE